MRTVKDKVTSYMAYVAAILPAIYGVISIFGIDVSPEMKEVIRIGAEAVLTIAVIVIGLFTGKESKPNE